MFQLLSVLKTCPTHPPEDSNMIQLAKNTKWQRRLIIILNKGGIGKGRGGNGDGDGKRKKGGDGGSIMNRSVTRT